MKTRGKREIQVPTAKQIESLMADVAAIGKRVEAFTVTLSATERLGILKMRSGGEQVIATIGQLASQHEVSLPNTDAATMNAALQRFQRLRPLLEAIQRLERRVDDTVLTAKSASWNDACALYTALARSASANPDIETALRPVVAFFSLGGRRKTPLPSAPPSAPSSAPTSAAPSTPSAPTSSAA